ncbi:hypothetical protein N185_13330 [Sinorhizobium sp. GW3]|nr:hypothetical protein N185_13330 [Sinorhizobium sp. GW3]
MSLASIRANVFDDKTHCVSINIGSNDFRALGCELSTYGRADS